MRTESPVGLIYDRLYGRNIPFTATELLLFQTPVIARQREISLSAVPTWTIPTGICAHKFEHAAAVGYLTKLASSRVKELKGIRFELYCAGLGHDAGTPPFSHLTEHFLRIMYGLTHEAFAVYVLQDSEFSRLVTQQGGDMELILDLIQGRRKPLSDIMNGSIDFDNLDNTLRYGLSMGIISRRYYNPTVLARSFSFMEGQLTISEKHLSQIMGWMKCREKVYEYVTSIENHRASSMVYRAIELARRAGKITMPFFTMTDAQAYAYLELKCGKEVGKIMQMARQWKWYSCALQYRSTNVPDKLYAISQDREARTILSDEVSKECGIPPHEVTCYVGIDERSARRPHFKLRRNDELIDPPYSPGKPVALAYAFLHPHWDLDTRKQTAVREFMNHRLGLE